MSWPDVAHVAGRTKVRRAGPAPAVALALLLSAPIWPLLLAACAAAPFASPTSSRRPSTAPASSAWEALLSRPPAQGGCFGHAPASGSFACWRLARRPVGGCPAELLAIDLLNRSRMETLVLARLPGCPAPDESLDLPPSGPVMKLEEVAQRLRQGGFQSDLPPALPLDPDRWVLLAASGIAVRVLAVETLLELRCPDGRLETVYPAELEGGHSFSLQLGSRPGAAVLLGEVGRVEEGWYDQRSQGSWVDLGGQCGGR